MVVGCCIGIPLCVRYEKQIDQFGRTIRADKTADWAVRTFGGR